MYMRRAEFDSNVLISQLTETYIKKEKKQKEKENKNSKNENENIRI